MKKTLEHLITAIIVAMRKAGYAESTLEIFRIYYKHLMRLMSERSISEYSAAIGAEILPSMKAIYSCEKNQRMCGAAIRHLNNFIAGVPFETPKGKRRRESISVYPEFDEYLEWCAVRGFAQSTVNKRHDIVKIIAEGFIALELEKVELLDLRLIIDYCKSLSPFSLSKKHTVVTILKELLKFLYGHGYIAADYADSVLNVSYNGGSKIPSYYSPDEVSKILKAINPEKALHKRNYAIILIAARTGMRRSDIAQLKFSSVNFETDKIEIVQQKTGVSLYLPLLPEVGEALADYMLNARPIKDSEYIFLKHFPPHDPISPGTINDIVFRATEKSGVEINSRKRGPHALRFSLASRMLADGKTIKTIADALGHKNIQTTTIYTKIDTPNLGRCALPVPEYREMVDFYIDERLETLVVGDLAAHIVDYILYKRSMGQKASNDLKHLSNLARFSLSFNLSTELIPQEMAVEWLLARGDEKPKSQYDRRIILTGFAIYLRNLGFSVYIPETAKVKSKSKFTPHIFSDSELACFFSVTDSLEIGATSVIMKNQTLPSILFRLLLGCGLRVSEALNIKRNDVNFNEQTIRILESKNHKDRLVVMEDSLCQYMKRYINANMTMPEQFIFVKDNGEQITPSLIYNWFRDFLTKAGITHKGKDYGPRVHDFRHTFAVRSLNKMLDEGKPLYTALPILKDYLGHHDISATEDYVRFAEWMIPDVVAAMNSVSEQIVPDWGAINEA